MKKALTMTTVHQDGIVEYQLEPVFGSNELFRLVRIWHTESITEVPFEARPMWEKGDKRKPDRLVGYREMLCQHPASGSGFEGCIENAEVTRKAWQTRRGRRERKPGAMSKYAQEV